MLKCCAYKVITPKHPELTYLFTCSPKHPAIISHRTLCRANSHITFASYIPNIPPPPLQTTHPRNTFAIIYTVIDHIVLLLTGNLKMVDSNQIIFE